MDIGIVGLGNMGAAIASRLLSAGHDLTVYNRTPSKAEPFLEMGAMLAHDPAGAAQGDVVITVLPDDHVVSDVMWSADSGMSSHQGAHTIHVSVSTISVALSKQIEASAKTQNRSFISSPVMGRPDVAQRGELIVMAGGDKALIEKCQPIFDAIGKTMHVVGQHPWQANLAKLAANFMISSMIETYAEAFALVRKNGVDHHKFLKIMASDFFQSPVYEKYGKIIADGKFDTGAFTVRLQEKDTRLALEAAIASQVPMPFASAIENAFLTAIGRGKGDLDPCAIAQIAAENAGLSQDGS